MANNNVYLPSGIKPLPTQHEISAAQLLALYFATDVEFIMRTNQKTPDFLISDVKWELKSPTGSGKYNVEHQIKSAARQSCNVIIDTRRSKIHMTKLRHELMYQFRRTKAVKRLIVIEKSGNVIELG